MIPERVPERPTGADPLDALLSELRRRGVTLHAVAQAEPEYGVDQRVG
ncbi:hypothetical protein [Endothiovibrio diazotrophicus]